MKRIFSVEKIYDDFLVLKSCDSDNLKIELPIGMFDIFMIRLHEEIEVTINIPYGVSSQRRRDISEHHAEEARCGNI